MAEPEEATQPSTQLVIDPRRLGHQNSGLNDEDLVDIICILHPSTLPALEATALVAKQTPQHTLYRHGQPTSRDIALRLSASLKCPQIGFQFGRNTTRCDVVIGSQGDGPKRVSNVHFRIYLNEYGSIMLEDFSTNGTKVDEVLLRGKDKENGFSYQHMLENGSVVTMVMTPPEEDIRFIVRIPQRDIEHEQEYSRNLTKFFLDMKNKHQKPDRAAKGGTPDIFADPEALRSFSTSRHLREWRGGPKYNKVSRIGKGAFATVYLLTDKFHGQAFAAKELDKRRFMKNGVLDQKVETEMKIMSRIKHPNIVQFIEHIDWDDHLFIIMEYVPNGDLGQLILEKGRLSELAVKSMTGQLLSVLQYLHGLGITHRDIKPDNILIQSRDPFHVKLTDFGLSKMVEGEDTFLRTFCGTLLYCAPEVYSEYREYNREGVRQFRGKDKRFLPPQRYGHAVDIWSLAGVLFYSLSGSPPYPASSGTSYQELLSNIMTKALDIRPLQRCGISDAGIQFLKSMLRVRPEERATIEELENSAWLQSPGGDVMAVDEQDEVDLVSRLGDDALSQAASQLDIGELGSQIDSQLPTITAQNWAARDTIPSSFSTADGSTEVDSFSFLRRAVGPPRLFGEINASALGSSGVITSHDRLNLLVSQDNDSVPESQVDSQYVSSDPHPVTEPSQIPQVQRNASEPATTVAPPTHDPPLAGPHPDVSLLGAESMVAQMKMSSPELGVTQPAPDVNLTTSRRRPAEDEPAEPLPKRPKSSRHIEMPLSKSIFWDVKDKSTWHDNYPDMTLSEFREFEERARAQGELFKHGQKAFDEMVQKYRNSNSPSVGTGAARAQSEPTTGTNKDTEPPEFVTAPAYIEPNASEANRRPSSTGMNRLSPGRLAVADARPNSPRPILAELVATETSVLPHLVVNVADRLTSWGRGTLNTEIYTNGNETRIPKYAFKIFVWVPHPESNPPLDFAQSDQSYHFFISTKSTQGIRVNGVQLSSHDNKRVCMPSRFWGQLHDGDVVNVWSSGAHDQSFVFHCSWGASRQPRPAAEHQFTLLDAELTPGLDRQCYQWEKEFLDARDREQAARRLRELRPPA